MTLQIAVIGSGFMARTHLDAYASVDGAEVVSIVSRSQERGQAVAVAHDISWSNDVDAIMSSDGIDAIYVCVPTPPHVEMTEAGLLAGKSVLLEKPIALEPGGADRLVDLEAKVDGVLMVGLIRSP